MKKLRKIFLVICALSSLLIISGCEKKESKDLNVAVSLVNEFNEIIKNDTNINSVATKISESQTLAIGTGVMEVEEGYLDGFDGEISGFNKGYAIKPMISSQPFIAYVFETSNATGFAKTLENQANKRWNICTEADDLEISVVNNYVFLVMSPSNFNE